jgi:hypothetical protein
MPFKRVTSFFALIAGAFGLIGAVVVAYPIWLVVSRLDLTHERFFLTVDNGLVAVQDRIRGVQKRLRELQTSAGEIAQNLRAWNMAKAKEKLASAVDVERRTEKLAVRLQIADQWLDRSMDSIRGIEQLLQLGASVGARVDPGSLQAVLDGLATAQRRLQETEESIERIRDFVVNRVDESKENRLSRALKLIASTESAADAIDGRLENSLTRLSQMQTVAMQLQKRTSNFILLLTGGSYLILIWVAAGQAALSLYGWKNYFRSGLVQPSNRA